MKPSDMLRLGMGLGLTLSAKGKGFLGELGERSSQDRQREGMGLLDDANTKGKGIGTAERGAEKSEKSETSLGIAPTVVKVKWERVVFDALRTADVCLCWCVMTGEISKAWVFV